MDNEKKQYVYIFSNTVNPEILKIGKTNSHPEIRANQLSNQTGSIGKYQCIWSMEVLDNYLAEGLLHFIFRPFHHNKEFFRMEKDEAIVIANKAILDFNSLMQKHHFPSEPKDLDSAIEGLELLLEDLENKSEKLSLQNYISPSGARCEAKRVTAS